MCIVTQSSSYLDGHVCRDAITGCFALVPHMVLAMRHIADHHYGMQVDTNQHASINAQVCAGKCNELHLMAAS